MSMETYKVRIAAEQTGFALGYKDERLKSFWLVPILSIAMLVSDMVSPAVNIRDLIKKCQR